MVNLLAKLFNQITETEIVPTDWSKMIVTPIHIKRSQSVPGNFIAISFL